MPMQPPIAHGTATAVTKVTLNEISATRSLNLVTTKRFYLPDAEFLPNAAKETWRARH